MNKSIQLVFTVAFAAAISILFYFQFSQNKDIVYVNSSKLLNGYQGMIDARADYQQKAGAWKANIDTLSLEVQNAIKDYEKESAGMTAKENELSKELIRTKQKQLMDYQRAMKEKAAQEDNAMTSQVIEQVNAYLKKYGEQRGYQIIMAATEYGNVAYADESLDVTEEVLEGLNKSYNGQ